MAQKLTSGLLKTILSIPCRKFHLMPSALHKLPAVTKAASFSVFPTIQRSHFSTADAELRDFLKEEIEAEKRIIAHQSKEEISGFEILTDEANVTLTKKFNNEKISVHFNVNDSVRPQDHVETGTMDEIDEQEEQEQPEDDRKLDILAEPCFRVEIDKNNEKLVFECEFVPDYQADEQRHPSLPETDEEADLFNIASVYLTTSEVTEKVYGASGEILDGTLYDHLFDYLAERGIDNKFAKELVKFATNYEHAQYVSLLSKLKKFVSP